MEEDIKELEAFVNHYKNLGYFGVIRAIENLIARNKKLEKTLDDDIGNIVNLGLILFENSIKPKDVSMYVEEAQVFLNTLNEYYIPKSKVIEIIENYYNEHSDTKEEITKFIEELLQGGDK